MDETGSAMDHSDGASTSVITPATTDPLSSTEPSNDASHNMPQTTTTTTTTATPSSLPNPSQSTSTRVLELQSQIMELTKTVASITAARGSDNALFAADKRATADAHRHALADLRAEVYIYI